MPPGLNEPASVTINNTLYIFGGARDVLNRDTNVTNDFWCMTYDPVEGRPLWLELCANCSVRPPVRRTALMGVFERPAEQIHSVFIFGGAAVANSSSSSSVQLLDMWQIDVNFTTGLPVVAREWRQICTDVSCVESMPEIVGAATTIDNKLYMFGQLYTNTLKTNAVSVYDPLSARWEIVCEDGVDSECCAADDGCPPHQTMNTQRLASNGTHFFVIYHGGTTAGHPLSQFWKFDVGSNTWALVCTANDARCAPFFIVFM